MIRSENSSSQVGCLTRNSDRAIGQAHFIIGMSHFMQQRDLLLRRIRKANSYARGSIVHELLGRALAGRFGIGLPDTIVEKQVLHETGHDLGLARLTPR